MTASRLHLLKINDIKLLFKKNIHWYFKIDSYKNSLKLEVDIDSFLSINKQFIQISPNRIINLNYLDDYVLEENSSFLIISGERYTIAQEFVPQVRVEHKNLLHEKYFANLPVSEKGSWISRQAQYYSEKDFANILNLENIKYMIRNSLLTEAYYIDGKTKHFYETLKYFEQNFKQNTPLIRANRNCIINIEYIESYKTFTETKTAEVIIDSKKINVSRRQLPKLRKKIKKNGLIILKQKGV